MVAILMHSDSALSVSVVRREHERSQVSVALSTIRVPMLAAARMIRSCSQAGIVEFGVKRNRKTISVMAGGPKYFHGGWRHSLPPFSFCHNGR